MQSKAKAKTLLGRAEVSLLLKSVPNWKRHGDVSIRRRFEFGGFLGSIAFVNRVAVRAEAADHHPDINVRWNKVTLTLSSHDVGGLTTRDFKLARECDGLFEGRQPLLIPGG